MIDFVQGAFHVSIRKACRALPACRATCHYRSRRPDQVPLRKRIREIAETRMRYGYALTAITSIASEYSDMNERRLQKLAQRQSGRI